MPVRLLKIIAMIFKSLTGISVGVHKNYRLIK